MRLPRTHRSWLLLSLVTSLAFVGCDGDGDGEMRDGGGGRDDAGSGEGDGGTRRDAGTSTPRDSGPMEPAECGDTELTEWEQMMLDEHNRWRSEVDPPAADMHRMYWDSAIAANAAAWVASCDPDWPHSDDSDRDGVGGYEHLGENLSYCAGTGCSDLPSVTDGSGMGDGEGWWDERHDYTWETDESSDVTSHYTEIVSSNAYAIGCATQRCDAPGPFGWDGEWWWTICQYGPRGQGYWSGTKPYESGSGGLVDPDESVWDDHPGLCR